MQIRAQLNDRILYMELYGEIDICRYVLQKEMKSVNAKIFCFFMAENAEFPLGIHLEHQK